MPAADSAQPVHMFNHTVITKISLQSKIKFPAFFAAFTRMHTCIGLAAIFTKPW